MSNSYAPRLIQVIESSLELRGTGEKGNPYRRIRQYYSVDGELLAEHDPCAGDNERPLIQALKDILSQYQFVHGDEPAWIRNARIVLREVTVNSSEDDGGIF